MVQKKLLYGEIAKAELSQAEVARRIGMTPKTFYTKVKKGVFGSDEIVKIVEVCGIADPLPIFFPEFDSR